LFDARCSAKTSGGFCFSRESFQDEHRSVGPTQMHSTWHALLQDVELMPQYQDFGFQSPSRLEAIAQHADEKEADCNHAAIMF